MRGLPPWQTTVAFLVVLAVAGGVRVAMVRWMATQPLSEIQFVWSDSDMATHWQWAGRIVDGDVLTRDARGPYPPWMQKIAPLETWDRWHGERVFNKAPLYPYALAAMRAAVGERYLPIGLCHAALGVLNVALVFLLATRFFDRPTAVVAGLGAALYGPFLLYDTFLLRDGLAVTVSLLMLLALARCTNAARGPWILAGAAFALALLGRELVAPFGALVVLWIWQRFRAHRAQMIGALGPFAFGAALGLLPLVARNIAVGAPPIALSAVGVEGFVYGHAVDTAPAAFNVPAATANILRASDGHVVEAIRGTLATYEGDWWRLLHNEALRAAAIFSGLEGSDNVNWYYHVDRSPILAYSIRYEIVLGLGLVGLWLARRRVRGDDRIVLYYLGLSLAALQFVPVIGRYRLVPAALLLIYAAVTVVAIGRALRARQWRTAGGVVFASMCLTFVSARLLLVASIGERCRTAEYLKIGETAVARQDYDLVYETLRDLLGCVTRHAEGEMLLPGYHVFVEDFVTVAESRHRMPEAAGVIDRLAATYGRDPVVQRVRSAVAKQ